MIYHQDDWLTVLHGDAGAELATLPAESVHCVVTSPPYWGLRDYGVPPSVWNDRSDPLTHVHEWAAPDVVVVDNIDKRRWNLAVNGRGEEQPAEKQIDRQSGVVSRGSFCACGAWLGNLGLEPTPDEYVANLVAVFREVRRVLRKDGTVWLNLGDSYVSTATSRNAGGSFQAERRAYVAGRAARSVVGGLKPKNRVGIPPRVVLALQADGWWWRDEIVWQKPNPMPFSGKDRATPAHEMVYLLTKSARYWYDHEAIREAATGPDDERNRFGARIDVGFPGQPDRRRNGRRERNVGGRTAGFTRMPGGEAEWAENGRPGRNKRSVWAVATEPYPEAHFATFPRRLIEPMILAGCPAGGVVLDPFGGSGTVAVVAQVLGRRAVLIELSADYCRQAMERIGRARGRGEGPAVDMPIPAPVGSLWAPD